MPAGHMHHRRPPGPLDGAERVHVASAQRQRDTVAQGVGSSLQLGQAEAWEPAPPLPVDGQAFSALLFQPSFAKTHPRDSPCLLAYSVRRTVPEATRSPLVRTTVRAVPLMPQSPSPGKASLPLGPDPPDQLLAGSRLATPRSASEGAQIQPKGLFADDEIDHSRGTHDSVSTEVVELKCHLAGRGSAGSFTRR